MSHMYDFNGDYAQTYTNKCKCGEEHQVSTQTDDEYPEYHTEIFIKCKCGESVRFDLPVN